MFHLVFENFRVNFFFNWKISFKACEKIERFCIKSGFLSLNKNRILSKSELLYPMAVVLKVQWLHQLNPEVQIHSPHRPTRWGALGFSPATCLLLTLQVTLVQTKCDPLPYSSSPRSSLEENIFLLVFDVPDGCGPCCRTDECACLTFLGTVSPVPGVSQLHGCMICAVTGTHSQSPEFALMLCSSVLAFLILLSLILCFLCEV